MSILSILTVVLGVILTFQFGESITFRSRFLSRHSAALDRIQSLRSQRSPAYWYCRRGSRLDICHRNTKKGYYSLPYRNYLTRRRLTSGYSRRCIGCLHGKCVLGKCRCSQGWNGDRCNIDANECSSKEHFCAQLCVNTPGSYRCACRYGYTLATNGKTCTRARDFLFNAERLSNTTTYSDERRQRIISKRPRRIKTKTCRTGCRYRCIVKNLVEKCICPRGFSLAGNGRSCIDNNECLDGAGPICPENQECANTYGGYTCKCSAGYTQSHRLTGKVCEDLNECLTGEHTCGLNSLCVNTKGSYACACLPGHLKNGSLCVDATKLSSAPQDTTAKTEVYRYPWIRNKPSMKSQDLV